MFFLAQSSEGDLRQDSKDRPDSSGESGSISDSVPDPLAIFETEFDTFDANDDGFLSAAELEIVEHDEDKDDEVRRVAGLLARDIDAVEEYSNDEWFDENDGITVNDLRKMRLSDNSVPQPGFGNWLREASAGLKDSFGIGIVPIPDPLSWGESKVPTRVLHVYRGSAAEYAGLQSNDLITKINGQDVTQMEHGDVAELFNGERGSAVTLEIERGRQTMSLTIARKRQISSDILRTNFNINQTGPSQGKDADSSETCRPNREYARLIREAAYRHYNPFSMGDFSKLIHKYDCAITDIEQAHRKAQTELSRLTGDSYTQITDAEPAEDDKDQEEAAESSSSDTDVEEKDLGDGIAYIRLFDFRERSDVDRMREAIRKHDDARAFVIDLRNNPGGLLSVSLDISSMLIEDGNIVRTYERENSDPANPTYVAKTYSLTGNRMVTTTTALDGSTTVSGERRQPYLIDGRPVVVLVNRSSSSAAEILTGAMQDNDVATIVGSTTFGKGIGQETHNVSSQHALKMTTFRFTTPDGTWPGDARTNRHGIRPDVNVYSRDSQLTKGIEILRTELGLVTE